MISKKYELQNEGGLHIRASMMFSKAVMNLDCKVTVKFGDKEIDGTKFMQLFDAHIGLGDVIEVICDGPDEEKADMQIENMIQMGFVKMQYIPIHHPFSDGGFMSKMHENRDRLMKK